MLKPKSPNVKKEKGSGVKEEGCVHGSYELGRIAGMSEDLATSKRLIEAPGLIHMGPLSCCITQTV